MKKNKQNKYRRLAERALNRLKNALAPNPNACDPLGCRFDWQSKGHAITPSAK